MTKSNLKRRRRRTRPTTPPKKAVRQARFRFMLWGIILLIPLIAILWMLQAGHRDSDAPTSPPSADSRVILPLAGLELNGLSVKEQVTVLRTAAIELGRRLVTEFSQVAESHMLLGNTYRQLGQSVKAVECWQMALTLDPQRVDAYTYLAILEEEKGHKEQALVQWKKVLSLQPTRPGVRDSLANTLMSLNRWDTAIEVLNEELTYSPQSARTHYLLGRAYSQRERFTEAAIHYEKTIALDPHWTGAYYELATALTRSGQREAAQQYRRLFSERKQQDKTGATYGYTDQEDLLKAKRTLAGLCGGAADLYQTISQDALVLTLLKRVVILDPNNLGGRKRLAARYQALGRLPEALGECEQIARLAPDDPICQMLIGSLSARSGRYARAESAYQKMIVLAPNLSAGYHELAKIYLKTRKNLPQAQSLAQQAVHLDPTAGNYYVLGLAHHENGDQSSALKALRRALQLDPGNQTFQRTYDQLRLGK